MRVDIIILSLALILVTSRTSEQFIFVENNLRNNACTTQNNQQGRCINIRNCRHLVNLLQRKPVSREIIDSLEKLNCGYEDKDPKVCCEDDSLANSNTPLPHVTNYPGLHQLNDGKCGTIPTNTPLSVAIGSVPAKINEFPWMALLVYDIGKETPGFLCGGSIINSRYILTAAHCVTNLSSGRRLIAVRVGEYNTNTDRDCSAGSCNAQYQEFEIEEVVSHSEFSKKTMHNDIALIRINGDIKFISSNVQTICLPIGPTVIPDQFTVSGWGRYDDNKREGSSIIRKVELPRYSQDRCINTYKSKNVDIWDKQICVGGLRGVDGCEGDSGGPLQAKQFYNNKYRTIQYGIVSFGTSPCGVQGIPGVYTRIDSYLDWILRSMKDIPKEDYEQEIDDDYAV